MIYCTFLIWYLIRIQNNKEQSFVEETNECDLGKPSAMVQINDDACKNMYLSGTAKPYQLPHFIPTWKLKEESNKETNKEAVEKAADTLDASLMLPKSHYDCIYFVDVNAGSDDQGYHYTRH